MEAHGCREFPADSRRGRFVRLALEAAVLDCIVPRFIAQLAAAAHARAPGHARHGRPRDDLPARPHPLRRRQARRARPRCRRSGAQVLGADDMKALDDLYAQLIWVPDGENEPLSQWAQALPRHHRPARPAAARARRRRRAASRPARRRRAAVRRARRRRRRRGADGRPDVGSLKDALERACEQARADQLQQLDEDVDLAATLEQAARRGQAADARKGAGTGAPTGRMPDRGVDRPPFPDEVQEASRLAQRLLRARTIGLRRIDKRTPGGRFDGRAYARGRFERATGRPASSHPWTITREITAPLEEPHALLVVDTSGSMAAHEYALGPIVWIVDHRVPRRRRQGRHRPVRQRRRPAQRRHRADGQGPGDPRRRRHRVRRRRDRDRRRPPRDGEPPPPARRLRRLRRRLV